MTDHGYRIGFLTPTRRGPDLHAFRSFEMAAARAGHTLVHVATSDEAIAAGLDFLVGDSALPKLTHLPSFALVQTPRARFWERQEAFDNLVSYDGYVTLSDTLRDFLNGLCMETGKPPHVGRFCRTAPRRPDLAADIEQAGAQGPLRLCYLGGRADAHYQAIFHGLTLQGDVTVHGPEAAWAFLAPGSYAGELPFDGASAQAAYAGHGAGLVLTSAEQAIDDVVTSRLFDIVSVGAAAVCPDIPWVRDQFGETVWYFDPAASAYEITCQIDAALADIRANPAQAAAKARAARRIFEERLCGEVLIGQLIEYFEEWKTRGGRRRPPTEAPLVEVIVRVGSRPVQMVKRAIQSLEDQTAGRFRVLFIKFRPIDLSPITTARWERIEAFRELECLGGDRAATMTFGLSQVEAPLFALLDDDDFLLPGHFDGLLAAGREAPPDRVFAYCGIIDVEEGPDSEPEEGKERRTLFSITPARGDAWSIMGAFAPHNFIASRELLRSVELRGWTLRTAEDTLLNLALSAHGAPRFSYRATAAHVVGSSNASNFATTPTRQEDLLQAMLRQHTSLDQLEAAFHAPARCSWERMGVELARISETRLRARRGAAHPLVLEDGQLGASIHIRQDLDRYPILLDGPTIQLFGRSRLEQVGDKMEILVLPDSIAWSPGLHATLDAVPGALGPQWVVGEFLPPNFGFGFGVLAPDGGDFLIRSEVQACRDTVEIWLPVGALAAGAKIVVQNWASPLPASLRVRALWVVQQRRRQ